MCKKQNVRKEPSGTKDPGGGRGWGGRKGERRARSLGESGDVESAGGNMFVRMLYFRDPCQGKLCFPRGAFEFYFNGFCFAGVRGYGSWVWFTLVVRWLFLFGRAHLDPAAVHT